MNPGCLLTAIFEGSELSTRQISEMSIATRMERMRTFFYGHCKGREGDDG